MSPHNNGRPRYLPFRIPFFRIFYSTTYTILSLFYLILLAVTPASLIWTSFQNTAYQYIFMFGGMYILTLIVVIFIYASRLYTNRSVLAGVGKAYIPVEKEEISETVRRMIADQLERSAVVAWESRPRDLKEDVLKSRTRDSIVGDLPPVVSVGEERVGTIIPIDPANPPWGIVRHPGWSPPQVDDKNSHIQFLNVIAELPHLIEARAVSLAPLLPSVGQDSELPMADPSVLELLHRPKTMGVREYLARLASLGLIEPPALGAIFLQQYESARFGARPISDFTFSELMTTFSNLLAGMTELDPAVVAQIRANFQMSIREDDSALRYATPPRSTASSTRSPVTARTRQSRTTTPYLQYETSSEESLASVIHRTGDSAHGASEWSTGSSMDSQSLISFASDAGSVLRRPSPRLTG